MGTCKRGKSDFSVHAMYELFVFGTTTKKNRGFCFKDFMYLKTQRSIKSYTIEYADWNRISGVEFLFYITFSRRVSFFFFCSPACFHHFHFGFVEMGKICAGTFWILNNIAKKKATNFGRICVFFLFEFFDFFLYFWSLIWSLIICFLFFSDHGKTVKWVDI